MGNKIEKEAKVGYGELEDQESSANYSKFEDLMPPNSIEFHLVFGNGNSFLNVNFFVLFYLYFFKLLKTIIF